MQIFIDDDIKERLREQCSRRSSQTHHEFAFTYAKELIKKGLDAAERETDEQIAAELAAKKLRIEARAAGVSVSGVQSPPPPHRAPSAPVPAPTATRPSATIPAPSAPLVIAAADKSEPTTETLDVDELVRQANAARGHAQTKGQL